jgi:hypothetical protein
MRFRASPLMVAVAMGLLHPSVLTAEAQSRKARAEKPVGAGDLPAVQADLDATFPRPDGFDVGRADAADPGILANDADLTVAYPFADDDSESAV